MPQFAASAVLRLSPLSHAVCAVGLLLGGAVHAQEDPYNPYGLFLSQSVTRDNNVFRASSGVIDADTISSTTVGASLDQPIGRQQVQAQASMQFNRFSSLTELNNNVPSLNGQWNWQFGEHWEGELGASHVKSLYRYSLSDGQGDSGRNIETENRQFFRARLGVVTQWTLESGWSGYRRNFSADLYRSENQKQDVYSGGVRYQPEPDLTARLNLRRTDGSYPDFSSTLGADEYTRWDVDTLLNVRMSAATQVDMRLSKTRMSHTQPTAGSGPQWTGSLGVAWQPTGKLSFNANLQRDNDTSEQAQEDGSVVSQSKVSTRLTLGTKWSVTDKVQLGLKLRQSWRTLDHDVPGTGRLDGKDVLRVFALQVSYRPIQAVSLGCNASREVRGVSGETDLSYPYQANVFSCYGQLNWR